MKQADSHCCRYVMTFLFFFEGRAYIIWHTMRSNCKLKNAVVFCTINRIRLNANDAEKCAFHSSFVFPITTGKITLQSSYWGVLEKVALKPDKKIRWRGSWHVSRYKSLFSLSGTGLSLRSQTHKPKGHRISYWPGVA